MTFECDLALDSLESLEVQQLLLGMGVPPNLSVSLLADSSCAFGFAREVLYMGTSYCNGGT